MLFPALESFLAKDLGPLAVLRGEHEDLRELCRRVYSAGELRGRSEEQETNVQLQNYGSGIITVLRDHFYKEDRILFPMVTRFLTPEHDADLLHRMEQIATAAKLTPGGRP